MLKILQVLGNCFCSATANQLPGSTLDRLGLCRDQGEGCYATYTTVQVVFAFEKAILYCDYLSCIAFSAAKHHWDGVVHDALPAN